MGGGGRAACGSWVEGLGVEVGGGGRAACGSWVEGWGVEVGGGGLNSRYGCLIGCGAF